MLLSPPEILPPAERTIFLAGPIQGSLDWQSEAIRVISKLAPDIAIANPRREYMDGEFIYADQVDWETEHLERAAATGAIMFWLARENEHDCGRAHAQTTRFEIGEWISRYWTTKARVCIGGDKEFTGFRYIAHRWGIPLYETLGETCLAAVAVATLD